MLRSRRFASQAVDRELIVQPIRPYPANYPAAYNETGTMPDRQARHEEAAVTDTHDDGAIARDAAAPPSRRRFLGQVGAAGIAGMAVPLLGKTAASASVSRSAQPLAPVLNPLAGCTVFPSSSQTQASAIAAWSSLVYPIGLAKVYFKEHIYPKSSETVTDYANAGARVILCYKPRFGPSVTQQELNDDREAMVKSIKAFLNAKVPVAAVTIWNEPDNHKNNVPPMYYKALYANDYAALHALAPVVCCFSGADPQNAPGYFLQGSSDGVAVDYYGHNYLKGHHLSEWTKIAKDANVGFGVWESGDTSSGQPALSQKNFAKYLTSVGQPPDYPGDPVNSVQAVLDGWISEGRPCLGYAWWEDNRNPKGVNIIDNPSDFRIPYLRLLQASL